MNIFNFVGNNLSPLLLLLPKISLPLAGKTRHFRFREGSWRERGKKGIERVVLLFSVHTIYTCQSHSMINTHLHSHVKLLLWSVQLHLHFCFPSFPPFSILSHLHFSLSSSLGCSNWPTFFSIPSSFLPAFALPLFESTLLSIYWLGAACFRISRKFVVDSYYAASIV